MCARPGSLVLCPRRLKEASHINKSLFMLGHCMALLAAKSDAAHAASTGAGAAGAGAGAHVELRGPPPARHSLSPAPSDAKTYSSVGATGAANAAAAHIPYRSSVLTMLLRDSLGGNARTTLLATLSPTRVCAAAGRAGVAVARVLAW